MKVSSDQYTFAALIILFTTVIFSACTPASNAIQVHFASPTPGIEINIAATTELEFALPEIANVFQQRTGNKVNCIFGSEQEFARQIVNGASYDLFSARNKNLLRDLEMKNLLLPKASMSYARGQIVLVVSRKSGETAPTLNDLLMPNIKHISIPDPEHDSYGMAARQALEAAHIWDQVQGKLIYVDDSRQALQFVQNGDAEGGILAISVVNDPQINWTLIDSSLYQPLDQKLAMVSNSSHTAVIFSFMMFINSKDAQDILRKYGFILPGDTPDFGSHQP